MLHRRSSSSKLNAEQFKRPPLRQSNGYFGHEENKREYGWVSFKTVRRIGLFSFYAILISIFVLSSVSLLLYLNCSGGHASEFIPKTRALCYDIYQFLQTGRISPFTWDYKESFGEIGRISNQYSTSTFEWLKNFDIISMKDSFLSFVLECKETIFQFFGLIYDGFGHTVQLATKTVFDFFAFLWQFAAGLARDSSGALVGYIQWVKTNLIEFINDIPFEIEKLKTGWTK